MDIETELYYRLRRDIRYHTNIIIETAKSVMDDLEVLNMDSAARLVCALQVALSEAEAINKELTEAQDLIELEQKKMDTEIQGVRS